MAKIPVKISYGLLHETIEKRLQAGWEPDDMKYVQELAFQLVFAQRVVLKQVARELSKTSWVNGWNQSFTDRIGFDYLY